MALCLTHKKYRLTYHPYAASIFFARALSHLELELIQSFPKETVGESHSFILMEHLAAISARPSAAPIAQIFTPYFCFCALQQLDYIRQFWFPEYYENRKNTLARRRARLGYRAIVPGSPLCYWFSWPVSDAVRRLVNIKSGYNPVKRDNNLPVLQPLLISIQVILPFAPASVGANS